VGPSSQRARRCAALVALAVFATVAALGLLTHHERPLAIPAARAQRLAAQAPELRAVLRRATRVQTLYLDDDTVKVEWYAGHQAIAGAGVHADGSVFSPALLTDDDLAGGAPIAHAPLVLAGLTALFLLAVLRRPLRRRRSLDAVALALLLVPAVAYGKGYLALGEGSAAVLLAYLAVRGIALATAGPDPADDDPAPVLLDRAAARRRLPHLPRQVGLALLAATLLVIVTSPGAIDVAFANMEGATLLLHGTLPYGHLPGDVFHGDTYGLPIYLAYVPFAALWPATTTWDAPTGALLVGALAIGACVLGLRRARGAGTGPGRTPWPAIVALLAFPSLLAGASSGTNDVLIAAALVWAFAWFARPAASSALLALAGTAKAAPLVLLPLWLARLRGAELRRAVAACTAVGVAVAAALVALGGVHGPLDMAHAMSFQLTRRSAMSPWTALGLQAWQPVAEALALAIALGGATLVALDRAVASDPRRVAGLTCAVLAALQLAANQWSPSYLLWFAPPAMVALLGPLGAPAAAEPARTPAPAPAPRLAPG
jgi:hypothetical protein